MGLSGQILIGNNALIETHGRFLVNST